MVKLTFSVPEEQRRRLRMVAMHRGQTLEETMRQVLETWMSQVGEGELPSAPLLPRAARKASQAAKPRRQLSEAADGRPSGVQPDAPAPTAPDTAKPPTRQRRQSRDQAATMAPGATGNPVRNSSPKADPATWPQRAMELDWSQCPEAVAVQAAGGKVWAFRGTRRPLWDLFRNMQLGHSVDKILEHFPELNEEQVVAVIQFAGERMFIPGL